MGHSSKKYSLISPNLRILYPKNLKKWPSLVPEKKYSSKYAKNREVIFKIFIHNALDITLKHFSTCASLKKKLFRCLPLKIYKILSKFRVKFRVKWRKKSPKILFEVQKTRYLWRYIGICHIKHTTTHK